MVFEKLNRKHHTKLFTTPSHSQKRYLVSGFRTFYKYDVSETDTHCAEDLLKLAEDYASDVYGTKRTKFLTNGSTSGILAGVLALIERGDKVLVWRDAHPSHHNAIKLAGGEPVFYDLEKNEFGVPIPKTDFEIGDAKLLIITSPTYEGYVSDVKKIKEKYGVRLLVDEAHGALYPFSDRLPQTAIPYADITVQSLHKTAGGLNPTALLHSNCDADVDSALSMVNTTSPSYPLLMSIEKNIRFLNSSNGRKELERVIDMAASVRQVGGYEFGGDDLTKILVKRDGLTGFELSEKLYAMGIEDEKTNDVSTMLLTGIGTDKRKIDRLIRVLERI